MHDRVLVFDTTLRDGEQSPGVAFDTAAKLEIARALAVLRVDVIEAGFPRASADAFAAVQAVARADFDAAPPIIAAIARADATDIEHAWEALRDAAHPRIHVFTSTSDIHLEHELRTTRPGVKQRTRAAVAQARGLCDDVEFTVGDATRADPGFTAEVIEIALVEGATTINVPDTVGYAMPDEYAALLRALAELVPGLADVVLSVHCHDDLGLAVANTVAGAIAGARQVECSVNGLGERAGNAALEEVVMALHARDDRLGLQTGVDTTRLAATSALVSRLSGFAIAPNKAIVGANAFATQSAIHARSVAAQRETYQLIDPATVGARAA